jgi:glycosyltransferase involved in cell wall biosynthesis
VLNWQDRLNPRAGGAEIHMHEVFGRLARRGHDVTALVSGWGDAPARATIDDIDVIRTGSRHTFSVAAPAFFRRTLRLEPFDGIIEDLNKVPLFTPLWSSSPLVLLVHHLFGSTAFQEATLPFAAATWLLEKPLPAVYRDVPIEAVSESTAQDLVRRGFSRDRIVVIPNGVDLSFYEPDQADPRFAEPTALYLGRLKRYKRVDLILRAVRRLVDEHVPIRLLIAGKGDAAERLLALRAELDLEEIVDFRGYVTELEKLRLMRKSWVHVLTSPKEGWGISNLEAAACGTPTVASDSPGLRDSVVHGETGYLVPHGDVDALARRLRMVLENPSLRDELGEAARRFAAGFTWDVAADRTEAHLNEVLSPAGAVRPLRGPRPQDLETDHR